MQWPGFPEGTSLFTLEAAYVLAAWFLFQVRHPSEELHKT